MTIGLNILDSLQHQEYYAQRYSNCQPVNQTFAIASLQSGMCEMHRHT